MTINHRIDTETKTLADNMESMELATLHEAVRQAEKSADNARNLLSLDDTPQLWRMATCAADMLDQLAHYLPDPEELDESDEGCAA
jgi:hypothetical protein|nr:MAG TPA: hypothetical protein [Caudoviricetes sp.]